MQQFFRREALKKLSSPEQLNNMLVITPLRGWIAIVTGFLLALAFIIWGIFGSIPVHYTISGTYLELGSSSTIYSAYTGSVTKVYVTETQEIHKGDSICRVTISDNYARTIYALSDGMIDRLYVNQGSYLNAGSAVYSMRNMDEEPHFAIAVPLDESHKLSVGELVYIDPVDVDTETYGRIIGYVSYIADSILTEKDINSDLYGPELINAIQQESYVMVEVYPMIAEDVKTDYMNNFQWTKPEGNKAMLMDLGTVNVIVEEESDSPFVFLFNSLFG